LRASKRVPSSFSRKWLVVFRSSHREKKWLSRKGVARTVGLNSRLSWVEEVCTVVMNEKRKRFKEISKKRLTGHAAYKKGSRFVTQKVGKRHLGRKRIRKE